MPFIELKNINFSYPNGHTILKNVSFTLGKGERTSLSGANGAGKSTLLKIIMGLLPPETGDIIAFSKPRRVESDFFELRQRVGFVFQDPDDQLFCPTVYEDIAFGPLNQGKSKHEALEIVDETLNELGLFHLRNRITYKLSGGEKRLISLASVLAMKPEVLILDEPTNALDPDNHQRLIDILKALDQAILLVSHDAAFRSTITNRNLHLENAQLTRS